jgi:hypothetical protein
VLDDLKVVVAQVHRVVDGLSDVVQLRVMAVGVQPTDRRPVDEVVAATE